ELYVREADSIELSDVVNANGSVHVEANGTITATKVISTGYNVGLLTTRGSVYVDYVQASSSSGQVMISATDWLRQSNADDAVDVKAARVVLYARKDTEATRARQFDLEVAAPEYYSDVGNDLDLNVAGDLEVFAAVVGRVNVTAGGDVRVERALTR